MRLAQFIRLIIGVEKMERLLIEKKTLASQLFQEADGLGWWE